MTREFDLSPVSPTFEQIVSTYAEILESNARHGGLGIASILQAIMAQEVAEASGQIIGEQIEFDKQLEDSVVEGDMHSELQNVLHGDTFMRVGIALTATGNHLSSLDGKQASSSSLEPRIANTELFKKFLSGIQPEDVTTGNQILFNDVMSASLSTINACSDPELVGNLPKEQRGLATQVSEDALRAFVEVAPEYERLGLDASSLRSKHTLKPAGQGYLWLGRNATQEQKDEKTAHDAYEQAHRAASTYATLEDYVTYWGRGVLSERVAIGSMDRLAMDCTGFFDGLHDRLVEECEDIIALLPDARTHGFATEAIGAMLIGLRQTVDMINNDPDAWYSDEGNKQLLEQLIAQLEAAIDPAAK